MRLLATILIFLITAAFNAQPSFQNQSEETATEVLQKLLDKLNSYGTISYHSYRSINYFSENYHNETNGTVFLDFKISDTTLGFRYQLETEQSKLIFNGTESFYLNKKEKTIKINNKPKLADFASLSLFVNSVVTIKKVLPAIIADAAVTKTLTDTPINNRSYHLVSFVLQNKTISGLGNFTPTTIKRNFLYKVAIDKETFLPSLVIQTNDAEPKDYMLTSFTEFKPDVNAPSELSWYYSTYTNDYKPASEKRLTLIKQNTVAPDWQSGYFNNNSVTLSKLKGNVVLLEFWIKNCGYCIAAVPKVNALIGKHKGEKLQVIGINMHDSKEDMNSFYQRNQPNFKTVYDNNGKITNDYGVEAFPTVVLIDKKGSVLYSGDFDQEQIERLLKMLLK